MRLFEQKFIIIQDERKYKQWLYFKGWAVCSSEITFALMPQWLQAKKCIKSPLGVYIDIKLVSPSTLKRGFRGDMRDRVLDRDNRQCLICGVKEIDGGKLTLHHVRPYSVGGETTTRNLVTLCEECNQKVGANEIVGLYDLAELRYGFDPSLMNGHLTEQAWFKIRDISDNLMQTKCEVW